MSYYISIDDDDNNNNNQNNNNPLELPHIEVQIPQTDCWPHFHSITDNLGVICDQHVEFPTVICVLGCDNCYESEAVQLSHDAELAPIPHTGQKLFHYR